MTETVAVQFNINGRLRFLSHQETSTLFQRALVRAGVPVSYSKGFNPRPRVSLPLPRSVGVSARDELLCFYIDSGPLDAADTLEGLSRQVPPGIEIKDVELFEGRKKYLAESAEYVFVLKPGQMTQERKEDALAVNDLTQCPVRREDHKKGTTRMVDVRGYIESVRVEGNEITVCCAITPGGTVRVEELKELLMIEEPLLEEGVIRRNVRWQGRH